MQSCYYGKNIFYILQDNTLFKGTDQEAKYLQDCLQQIYKIDVVVELNYVMEPQGLEKILPYSVVRPPLHDWQRSKNVQVISELKTCQS